MSTISNLFYRQLGGWDNIDFMNIEDNATSLFIKLKDVEQLKIKNLFLFGIRSYAHNQDSTNITVNFYTPLMLCKSTGLEYKIEDIITNDE